MKTFMKVIVGLFLFSLGVLIWGLVFMKMWGWFIAPVFTTLPVLSFSQSIGVSVFISIITFKRDKEEKEFSEIVLDWFGNLSGTFILFGLAWVIYLFIS